MRLGVLARTAEKPGVPIIQNATRRHSCCSKKSDGTPRSCHQCRCSPRRRRARSSLDLVAVRAAHAVQAVNGTCGTWHMRHMAHAAQSVSCATSTIKSVP
eukprot:4826387-Pleurochrysis_carterae.AAC.2